MTKKLSDDLKLPAGVDAEAVLKAVADVDGNEELQRSNEAISAAKRNLEALLDNSLPALEPYLWTDSRTGNEIQFYIKRLGSIEIAEVALSINRDASGALQLYAPDSTPAAMVQQIIIKACVCEENGDPFFMQEDMKAFYNRPELVEMFLDLFIMCDQINPCILNTLKKT